MFDVIKIAKYLYNNTANMSNIKLQKMLFFAYVNYYIDFKKELFEDKFEAWVYGPVLPEIYKNISNIFFAEDYQEIQEYVINNKLNFFLNKVVNEYGDKKPFDLVEMTHQDEIWQKARFGIKPWETSKEKLKIIENISLSNEFKKRQNV